MVIGANVTTLNPSRFRAAIDDLCRRDSRLAAIVDRFGRPAFWHRPGGFPALALFILEQQVSLASAAAAYRKLEVRLGRVTPERVLAASISDLRADGVSRQKDRYLRAVATAITEGRFDPAALAELSDEKART
ncbi:MAG: DNA-3-methyladenine glycosylase family protein, partial [Actinomycetota bacterium]